MSKRDVDSYIKSHFSYSMSEGKVRRGGKLVGTVDKSNGYEKINILGRTYYSHRVAVFLLTGAWPVQVDHINGVRDDNRWFNLRVVDQKENMKNTRRRIDNKSGVTGVYWYLREIVGGQL